MMPTQTQLSDLIEAVREIAQREVTPLFRKLEDHQIGSKTNEHDLVTVADRAAEEQISHAANRIWSEAVIIGEEAVADRPTLLNGIAGAELSVVVDPIDGTGNFVSGLATFGMIIAVCIRGETIFGLLYDPLLDDWVFAERGSGTHFVQADLSARQLTGGPRRLPAESRGYLPLHLFPPNERAELAACYPKFNQVTSLGCSCHEYRQLAAGNVDFCYSPAPKPWDHAAGVLVVEEAGGRSSMSGGGKYSPVYFDRHLMVIANNHSNLSLRDFGAG